MLVLKSTGQSVYVYGQQKSIEISALKVTMIALLVTASILTAVLPEMHKAAVSFIQVVSSIF